MEKNLNYEKIELAAKRRRQIKNGVIYTLLTLWGLMVLFSE